MRDVVVTGLGATTPLGGDVASTWQAALAGTSGARTLDNDWAETYEIPVTFAATLAVPAAEVLPRAEIKRMDPSAQYAIIATREAWAHAGRPRGRPRAAGRRGLLRHRRDLDHARRVGHAAREGRPAGPADDRADAHAELPGRLRRARARRPGRSARAGVGVRLGCRGDRLRGRDDPLRPRRRRGRRRHRGGDPPDAARRVRRLAHAVDPQRRPGRGVAPVRHRARRVRARRGRRHRRAGERRARRGPRCHRARPDRAASGCRPTGTT